jgi:hypothetical protein
MPAAGADGTTDVSCAMIAPPTRIAQNEETTAPAPALSGGTLVPGRYVLTTLHRYDMDSSRQTSADMSSALVIGAGSSFAIAVKSRSGKIEQQSGKLIVSGGKLTGTVSCSNPPQSGNSDKQGEGSDYEATADGITLRGKTTVVESPAEGQGASTTTVFTSDMIFVKE